jgi:hypothetical protein
VEEQSLWGQGKEEKRSEAQAAKGGSDEIGSGSSFSPDASHVIAPDHTPDHTLDHDDLDRALQLRLLLLELQDLEVVAQQHDPKHGGAGKADGGAGGDGRDGEHRPDVDQRRRDQRAADDALPGLDRVVAEVRVRCAVCMCLVCVSVRERRTVATHTAHNHPQNRPQNSEETYLHAREGALRLQRAHAQLQVAALQPVDDGADALKAVGGLEEVDDGAVLRLGGGLGWLVGEVRGGESNLALTHESDPQTVEISRRHHVGNRALQPTWLSDRFWRSLAHFSNMGVASSSSSRA